MEQHSWANIIFWCVTTVTIRSNYSTKAASLSPRSEHSDRGRTSIRMCMTNGWTSRAGRYSSSRGKATRYYVLTCRVNRSTLSRWDTVCRKAKSLLMPARLKSRFSCCPSPVLLPWHGRRILPATWSTVFLPVIWPYSPITATKCCLTEMPELTIVRYLHFSSNVRTVCIITTRPRIASIRSLRSTSKGDPGRFTAMGNFPIILSEISPLRRNWPKRHRRPSILPNLSSISTRWKAHSTKYTTTI